MTNPIPVEGLSEDVRMTLADCPIGLFVADRAGLCLKTEYGNNEGRIDAYIVSSGEFFWGDAPQTIASQRAQLVTPVSDVTELQHRRAEAGGAERVWLCAAPAGEWSSGRVEVGDAHVQAMREFSDDLPTTIAVSLGFLRRARQALQDSKT